MSMYIKNGRYNASSNMFIYYEKSNKNFWASIDDKKIEVCYGPCSGDCDYWDLDIKHKDELLKIVDNYGFDTRKLLKYVKYNNLNKKEEVKNGLGVKLNLVGKDGNSFSLLSLFSRTALKQGFTVEQINPILEEARSGDYSHLLCTLLDNCN